MIDLLIITAPFTYTFGPSLSPALLKACCTKENIQTTAWDLSAEFNFNYQSHVYYSSVQAWMESPELQLSINEFNWYSDIVRDYANTIIKNYKPKNLAVSILTQNSLRFAEDICYNVKLVNPEIKILLGGSGMDIFQHQLEKKWYELMIESGMADVVIIGEGEYALPRIINNDLFGVVHELQLTNDQLDCIPIPDYSDYDFSFYTRSNRTYWSMSDEITQNQIDSPVFLITASKGCVKNCNFCDVGKIWNKFRFRSGQKLANEMIYLYHQYNAQFFSFTDSLMNGGLKPYYEMNKILAEQLPRTIKYDGQIICRSQRDMPEKYFSAMSAAGCSSVSIGIESGSEQVRMHMGKGSSQDDVYYTTQMLTKYNINQKWNIIAGYPTETNKDWQQTMNLIKHFLPVTNGLLTIVPIDTFMLLDGTPMMQKNVLDSMKINQNLINGYSTFAWTTGINLENTYPTRADRFIKLCNFLLEFNFEKYKYLVNKIDSVNKKLYWYNNEYKSKKIFSTSAC